MENRDELYVWRFLCFALVLALLGTFGACNYETGRNVGHMLAAHPMEGERQAQP